MHCNGCKTITAIRTVGGAGWEVCNECERRSQPKAIFGVIGGPTKGKLSKQPKHAVLQRNERDRDKIINQMIKIGGNQVSEFSVDSKDTRGNIVRENFETRGGRMVGRNVLRRPNGKRPVFKSPV